MTTTDIHDNLTRTEIAIGPSIVFYRTVDFSAAEIIFSKITDVTCADGVKRTVKPYGTQRFSITKLLLGAGEPIVNGVVYAKGRRNFGAVYRVFIDGEARLVFRQAPGTKNRI